MNASPAARSPALARRLASAFYDLLLTVALAMVATLPFVLVFGDATDGWRRHLLQAWVVAVIGTYYVASWSASGQTLPMKTWKIRLVRAHDGARVSPGQAVHRYLLALLGTAALGLGFAWAFFDRDRRFLHDRLAGTALVTA